LAFEWLGHISNNIVFRFLLLFTIQPPFFYIVCPRAQSREGRRGREGKGREGKEREGKDEIEGREGGKGREVREGRKEREGCRFPLQELLIPPVPRGIK
jgi:hypothetical protein